jgi:dihydroorotate dehydrogenase (fumarate)
MTPDLSTTYLGLPLKNPFLVGASPVADQMERVRTAEKAGASAIVMHSLFEEQINLENNATEYHTQAHSESFAEALSYFPAPHDFAVGPNDYLRKVTRLKEATHLPIIASLNGVTVGGWTEYASLIEKAGADALELNFYHVATDAGESSEEVEQRLINVLTEVRSQVAIPLSVKLSPFYTSLPHLVGKLEAAGADGVVLFNRFYQPDIDIEEQETTPRLKLSDASELLLRLRWIAALYGKFNLSLGLSGGAHHHTDVIKGLMTGADAVQMVSCLLMNGIQHLATIHSGLMEWMIENEFESVEQLKGSMSMQNCPDPAAFERANYMRTLQGWVI